MCVEGRGRISRSGLTQDIEMDNCVFQCDVPHQWIAQGQVSPVSVYCDRVGCYGVCLRQCIFVWQHIGQSTTASSKHRLYDLRCLKVTLNPNKTKTVVYLGLENKKIVICTGIFLSCYPTSVSMPI